MEGCRERIQVFSRKARGQIWNVPSPLVLNFRARSCPCMVQRCRGEGYCIFNDIACAAHVAMRDYGVQRVMVIDLDVHQVWTCANQTRQCWLPDNESSSVPAGHWDSWPSGGRSESDHI